MTRVLVAFAVALALVVPAGASAADRLDRTIDYIRSAQNADGGFGGTSGAPSDPLFSAWVVLALAAAGINPKDQKTVGGTDAYAYVAAHADALSDTTDFERALLVAVAAGTSPRDFGGRDLVAAILARRLPDGSLTQTEGGTSGAINTTAFAMLGLSAVEGVAATTPTIARGAAWLVGVQAADGGWSWAPGQAESSDMTAAVIQALRVAPRTDRRADAQARGWAYLKTTQRDDGGFAQTPTDLVSNSASTAWALQAMWAAGIDPATWRRSGGTPLDYLASLQQPDGSITYMKGRSLNDLWMTAYAAPAIAGYPLPVPPVTRSDGRGGRGADLFSRPQSGSTGAASGGIRMVSGASQTKKTARRPGAKKAATGTAQSNGVATSGVTSVASPTQDPKKTGGRTPRPRTQTTATTAGEPVTGRLLASAAPAGVSGTGADQLAAAPGIRAAKPRDSDDATVWALAALLLVASASGAALEARHGRKAYNT